MKLVEMMVVLAIRVRNNICIMKRLKFCFFLLVTTISGNIVFSQGKLADKNDITYAFIDAIKNKTFGNYGQAIYTFQNCIKRNPDCAACYYEISKLFFSGGDKIASLQFAEKAANLDSKNYWYLRNLAEIQVLNEKFINADSTYKKLFWIDKIRIEDRFAYTNVLFHTGKPLEALKIFDDIEKENGFSEVISFSRYKYFFDIRNYKRAELELKKLIQYFPENYNYYGMLAEVYAIQKRNNEAFKFYNILLKYDAKNVPALISFGRFYISLHDTANANVYFNKLFDDTGILISKKIDAISEFGKENIGSYSVHFLKNKIYILVQNNPQNARLLEAVCDFYDHIKEYKYAKNYSEKLIDLDANNPSYWERNFYYKNILAEFNDIVNLSGSVTEKFSDRPLLYLVAGIANYELNNLNKAVKFLRSGYDISEKNEVIRNQFIIYLSEAYYKLGNKDSAYLFFEKGINLERPDIVLINNYAYYLSLDNIKLDKALSLSYETILANPKSSTFLDTYAWIFYKRKDYKNALKYIKQAVEYDNSNNPDILDHFGDICFCIKNFKKARQCWKNAIKFGGNSDILSEKIKNFTCD